MTSHFSKFIQSHKNLTSSWMSVRANSRNSTSPYVQEQAQDFANDERRRIRSISSRIQHSSYKFSKARGVAITKPGKPGAVRPIVISTVEDRVVQRCLLDALVSDASIRNLAFQPTSFGGIPKRDEDRAGVIGAIQALLGAVEKGATHVMVADIEGFFQKVRKSQCLTMISRQIADQRFLNTLGDLFAVDLANARSLWQHKEQFPYGDVGIAQGNCLSPFLGNLLLSEFDKKMNEGDCHCFRYIDDIIILAPSGRAASSRFRLATRLLKQHDMQFALAKTSPVPLRVADKFEYLGIEFCQTRLRPTSKARNSIVRRAQDVAAESLLKMRACTDAEQFDSNQSVPRVMNRISGMGKGWAHHYAFCSDKEAIFAVDRKICDVFMEYIDKAHKIGRNKKAPVTAALLGYRGAKEVSFKPLDWPS